MRNMSFFHTQQQIRDRTKTVTRRKGWGFLKAGDRFMAIVKGQGLKKGEKVERLAELVCVSNEPERLLDIMSEPMRANGNFETELEGFPEMEPLGFVRMFCSHMGGDRNQIVNRIEFEYV